MNVQTKEQEAEFWRGERDHWWHVAKRLEKVVEEREREIAAALKVGFVFGLFAGVVILAAWLEFCQ